MSKASPGRRSAVGASARPHRRERIELDEIVEAAGRLADRDGLAAVRLSHVAAAVGRSHSSLYHHVASIEALHRELALATVARLADALTAAAVGRSGPDAVVAVAHAYRDFVRSCRGRFEAAYTVRFDDDPELRAVFDRAGGIIDAVLRPFALGPAATFRAHVGLSAAIRGFVIGESQIGDRDDPDAVFDELVGAFVQGLTSGTWPTRSDPTPS